VGDDGPQGNPKWSWGEEVLAFELYLNVGMAAARHPSVVELSEYLRSLPLHEDAAKTKSFRNPNGVARKLADIGTRDPLHPQRKETTGSRLDRAIWERFGDNRAEVLAVARAVRERQAAGNADADVV
jgi:5-methylcytosine-specific restriction protein A